MEWSTCLYLLIFKNYFYQIPPDKLQYRNYKKFEVHSFLQDVEQLPEKICFTEWEKDFVKTCPTYDTMYVLSNYKQRLL